MRINAYLYRILRHNGANNLFQHSFNSILATQPFSLVTNQMLEITLNNFILDTHPAFISALLLWHWHSVWSLFEVSSMKPYIQLVIRKQWLQYVLLLIIIGAALSLLYAGQKMASQTLRYLLLFKI